jgi:hypothetical protein
LSPYGLIKARKIQLAIYQFGPGGTTQLIDGIRDTQCEGWVENVRVSPRGSAVTIDCLPSSEEGPLWDLVAVSGDASNPLLTAMNNLEKEERDSIQAVYFASPDEKGAAVLKDVGVLQVTTPDAKEKPDVFRSSILRVMARPSQLVLLQDRGFAALGALNAPLVMVHEQTGTALGSDAIYPVPAGLGSAKQVHYSPNGSCIEVLTSSQETPRAFAYYIVLEYKVLKKVAERMTGSTPCYDARHLCGFTEASQCQLKGPAQ